MEIIIPIREEKYELGELSKNSHSIDHPKRRIFRNVSKFISFAVFGRIQNRQFLHAMNRHHFEKLRRKDVNTNDKIENIWHLRTLYITSTWNREGKLRVAKSGVHFSLSKQKSG